MRKIIFLMLCLPGSLYFPAFCFAQAGQNNIYQGSGSSVLIQGDAFSDSTVDIDTNYWGPSIVPPLSSPPTTTYWSYFNFTAPHGAISFTPIPSELSCSDNLDFTKRKSVKPLSVQTFDSCQNALNAADYDEENGVNLGSAYDTMKWYITHCYRTADPVEAWGGLDQSFDSVSQTADGRQAAFNFVLFGLGLRTDDGWFCDGVPLLGIEFDSGPFGQTPNYRADRAIDLYLMNNPRCAYNYTNDSLDYANLLSTQWQIWTDTSVPGSSFDSSVPTLQQLGLDTLLVINAQAGVTFALPTPAIIMSASITENPFDNSTSIALSIGREALVTIQVFDILGIQVPGAGYAGVFEQGSATVPINMANAPPGAYYARISAAGGEVQTLKLTKE